MLKTIEAYEKTPLVLSTKTEFDNSWNIMANAVRAKIICQGFYQDHNCQAHGLFIHPTEVTERLQAFADDAPEEFNSLTMKRIQRVLESTSMLLEPLSSNRGSVDYKRHVYKLLLKVNRFRERKLRKNNGSFSQLEDVLGEQIALMQELNPNYAKNQDTKRESLRSYRV